MKLALNVNEAARAAGIGRTLLYEAISSGELVARKIGRRTLILTDDLDRWLLAQPVVVKAELNNAAASSTGSRSRERG